MSEAREKRKIRHAFRHYLNPEATENHFRGEMTEIVFHHEGLLDKHLGDALVAVWGAPVAAPDHPARCCRAAIAMLDALPATQAQARARGWPHLEGLNKGYGTTIIVSESTRMAAGDELVAREVDRVRIKGKAQPVAIYELLGLRGADRDGRNRRLADGFAQALAACRARCEVLRETPPDDAWDGVCHAETE